LCAGYKAFFRHLDRPLKLMSQLMRQEQPASRVMEVLAAEEGRQALVQGKIGRNDPCPCGSGLKYKKCHGGAKTATLRQERHRPERQGTTLEKGGENRSQ
ncbi:MAG: SEC-C metal-binding domain-containing protein, partial [Desulfobaccales bacterium]